MKKTKNVLLIIAFVLSAIISKSQTPGSSCSGALSIISTGTVGIMKQTLHDGWCQFTADAFGKEVSVSNLGGSSNYKIRKLIVAKGTCSV